MEETLLNGKPLIFYLRHLNALNLVERDDLHQLADKYPFSAHVHILVTIKDHIESQIADDELLEKASLYISDRRKLGQLIINIKNIRQDKSPSQVAEDRDSLTHTFEEQKGLSEQDDYGALEELREALDEKPARDEIWVVEDSDAGALEISIDDETSMHEEDLEGQIIEEALDLDPEGQVVESTEYDDYGSVEDDKLTSDSDAFAEKEISSEKVESENIVFPLEDEDMETPWTQSKSESEEDFLQEPPEIVEDRDEDEETVVEEEPDAPHPESIIPDPPSNQTESEEADFDIDTKVGKDTETELQEADSKVDIPTSKEETLQSSRATEGMESPFLRWLQKLESGNVQGGFVDMEEDQKRSKGTPPRKKKKKKKKKKKRKKWSEESLKADETLVSEALADLLAHQGHTQKAIDMYEKLRLTIPEKSVFFAQKIEALKQK